MTTCSLVSVGFGGRDAHYRLVRSRHTPTAAIREREEGQGAGERQNRGGRELIRMTVMAERLSGRTRDMKVCRNVPCTFLRATGLAEQGYLGTVASFQPAMMWMFHGILLAGRTSRTEDFDPELRFSSLGAMQAGGLTHWRITRLPRPAGADFDWLSGSITVYVDHVMHYDFILPIDCTASERWKAGQSDGLHSPFTGALTRAPRQKHERPFP